MEKPTDPTTIVAALCERLSCHPTQPLALTDEQRAAMIRAFSSRGKRRGYLLSRAPSADIDPMGFAAWQGMQPNPYKLSIGGAIMLREPESREFMRILSRYRFPGCLDYDRDQLEKMGAW